MHILSFRKSIAVLSASLALYVLAGVLLACGPRQVTDAPGALGAWSFSADGRYIALTLGSDTIIQDVRNAARIAHIQKTPHFEELIFSPDNRYLAGTDLDGSITLMNVPAARVVAQVRGLTQSLFHSVEVKGQPLKRFGFSRDSQTLFGIAREFTFLWNVASGRLTNILTGYLCADRGFALSHDGVFLALADYCLENTPKLASGMFMQPNSVGLWRLATLHAGDMNATSSSQAQDILAWRNPDHAERRISLPPAPPAMEQYRYVQLDFSPDDSHLLVSSTDGIHIIEAGGWKHERVVSAPLATGTFHNAVRVSDDGRLLAAVAGARVMIWDLRTGAVVQSLPLSETGFNVLEDSLTFSKSSKFLAVINRGHDGHVWSSDTGKVVREFVLMPSCRLLSAALQGIDEIRVGCPEGGGVTVSDAVTGAIAFRVHPSTKASPAKHAHERHQGS